MSLAMRKLTVVTKLKESILFSNPVVLTGQKALNVCSLAWSVCRLYKCSEGHVVGSITKVKLKRKLCLKFYE